MELLRLLSVVGATLEYFESMGGLHCSSFNTLTRATLCYGIKGKRKVTSGRARANFTARIVAIFVFLYIEEDFSNLDIIVEGFNEFHEMFCLNN